MKKAEDSETGNGGGTPALSAGFPLPVLDSRSLTVRPSRASRRRAVALTVVHLLMIAHIAHWLITGSTVSPIEPSEAMYTLNKGFLNAGAIFFAVAILTTMLLGRFVCGWGCHLVAYQDLCAWLLRRAGIKPKPFRSRLLVLAPLALALYMFVWPTAYRLWVGAPRPSLTNHMMTQEFWATFPGWGIAVLTIAVCGFAIVYFLGGKGFCTYACPYGGFFGIADQLAVGRIRVTDACKGCGHCTAVCTSNVRVHEEVARFGMVVDPGCMKCTDCISVCPNDALYFGFGKPAIGVKPSKPGRAIPYDFTVAEELLMALVGVAALLAYRGLYGEIPLLLAMGMAGITAFVVVKGVRLIRDPNVRLQNRSLKHGSRLTATGWVFVVATGALVLFTGHSAAVQFQDHRGRQLLRKIDLGDAIWLEGNDWYEAATPSARAQLDGAIERLECADRWGLVSTPAVLSELVWALVARGRLDVAERTVRRVIAMLPNEPEPHRGLAGVLRKSGNVDAARLAYHESLKIDPGYAIARRDLSALLVSMGRGDDAIAVVRSVMESMPEDVELVVELADLLVRLGRGREAIGVLESFSADGMESDRTATALGIACLSAGEADAGVAHLERSLAINADNADAHYNLAMAMLQRRQLDDAIDHLERAVALRPRMARAQYNLAVARYMAGRPDKALSPIREAIRLTPDDQSAYGFLAEVLRELGDPVGSQNAATRAQTLLHSQ